MVPKPGNHSLRELTLATDLLFRFVDFDGYTVHLSGEKHDNHISVTGRTLGNCARLANRLEDVDFMATAPSPRGGYIPVYQGTYRGLRVAIQSMETLDMPVPRGRWSHDDEEVSS